VPGIIQPEHLTPGCAVVGAGVRYEGRTLLPDVDERCEEVAGAITPRVGGVGPTTIAMLFRNLVDIAERRSAS
jgi:methylenetetrahydrofolate dehydrogenase (NADP+)/methenyltetrahydrofolate cyclohydrolase